MTLNRSAIARAFASTGVALAVLGAAGTVAVRTAAPVPITAAFGFDEVTMIGFLVAGLMWASIGALLVVRRPENVIGWLMVVIGVATVLSQLTGALAFAFIAEGTVEGDRRAQVAGWATVLFQLAGIFQIGIGFLFPTGRTQSAGWGRFLRVYWMFGLVFVAISLTQPGDLQLIPGVQNPFGLGPDLRDGRPIAPVLILASLIVFPGLVLSMWTRYRSGSRIERQQLKWFVLSLGISSIGLGFSVTEAGLLGRPDEALGLTIYVFAGAVVPLAIGVAILRYRLFDIDRIIGRTLAYATVTAVLVIVFTGVILLVGGVLTALASDVVPSNTIAVAISTLVVFALFQPVRRGVQRAVDRRFDRARYDAGRTVEAFTDRLRYDVDLAAVSQEIVVTATAAVRPASAVVWLRRAGR